MIRSAGILMPITSLPSEHGIGTMGKAAREFIDFLADAILADPAGRPDRLRQFTVSVAFFLCRQHLSD